MQNDVKFSRLGERLKRIVHGGAFLKYKDRSGLFLWKMTGLLLFGTGMCFGVRGQGQPAHPLPLNQAISLSLQHYPSIRAREAQVRAGQASVVEIRDRRLPSLNLYEQVDAGTSNNLGAAYFSGGLVPSLSGVSARPENIGTVSSGNIGVAYLQWQVTNFGGFKAEVQEAYSRLKVDSMDVQKEQFYIASIVLQSYLDLIRNYELSQVEWENLQRADTIRMAIRNYVLSGLRPGVDSSLAAAEYSRARLDLLDGINRFDQSKLQLALLTGLDTAVIGPDLSDDSLLSRAAGTEVGARSGSMGVAGVSGAEGSMRMGGIAGTAGTTGHPFLNYFYSIYENGQAQERLIRKSYLPKLYVLGAGWIKGSSINPDGSFDKDISSGLGYTRSNYLAGFGLSYDLFNPRKERDRLNVQHFQTEVALHNYEEQKQSLDNARLSASVNLHAALDKLHEIPVQLGAATDAYRQRLTQYHAGLANIIDLTSALNVLNRAQTDGINARDEVWRAMVQEAYAAGSIYPLLSILN